MWLRRPLLRFELKFQPGIDKVASGCDGLIVALTNFETGEPLRIKPPKARSSPMTRGIFFAGFLIEYRD